MMVQHKLELLSGSPSLRLEPLAMDTSKECEVRGSVYGY